MVTKGGWKPQSKYRRVVTTESSQEVGNHERVVIMHGNHRRVETMKSPEKGGNHTW